MWVRDPERTKAAIARHGESYRRMFMRYALFAGCKTGRVLRSTFGDDLLEHIEFEETTRQIAGDAKTIFPADIEHIRNALTEHAPIVVITFGKIAQDAVAPLWSGNIIKAHHPASRHPDTAQNLRLAVAQLREFLP